MGISLFPRLEAFSQFTYNYGGESQMLPGSSMVEHSAVIKSQRSGASQGVKSGEFRGT